MARRARMTVFSRFLIMMLFVGPLAYLGASYYNGEDGLQNVINLFNKGKEKITETRTNRTEETKATTTAKTDSKEAYEIRKLKEELEYKQKRLDELYRENEALQRKVKKLEKQVAGG